MYKMVMLTVRIVRKSATLKNTAGIINQMKKTEQQFEELSDFSKWTFTKSAMHELVDAAQEYLDLDVFSDDEVREQLEKAIQRIGRLRGGRKND